MKARYLAYEKTFDRASGRWCLTGKDSRRSDFGVGVGETPEVAERRLREWVLDSLLASAADGLERTGDLLKHCPSGPCLAFSPVELVPLRLRFLRAKNGLTQAQVAKRLGLTQQAYAKLERPGANPQLRTIQQVEQALGEELLELV